ncbi:hypothetical protein [Sedimentibacter sp.]|uniref:hypothetical protein n=1 Tax=Sedimentibacter sp. TaxID=1960295 RepID=UPI0028AA5B3D|nr:hypothetical protein [Sedimentibacter sp.]
MKQNIVLVFAKGYRMENDQKTGFNEGVSLSYLLTDDLSPLTNNDERGMRFSKSSISLDKGKNITKVPGLYEASFDIKADAKGQVQLKLSDVKFLSEVKLEFPDLSTKK